MTSDPPPNSSATFDALWESLDEESGIPPAIDPSAAAGQVPRHQRDTLLPPMPPPEYVQTMMELGEIDDPSDHPPPLRAPPPARLSRPPGRSTGSAPQGGDRRTPIGPEPKAAALGLVMASESELILPGEGSFEDVSVASGASRTPRQAMPPPPRPGTLHGGRRLPGASPGGKPAPLPGVGTPRAPSTPPPPMSVRSSAFDGLDGLEDLPFTGVVDTGEQRPPPPNRPSGTSFESFFGGKATKPRAAPPPRNPTPPPFHGGATAPVRLRAATPLPFSLDDDPMPIPSAPRPPPRRAMTPPIRSGQMTPPPQNAAGLRLGKLPTSPAHDGGQNRTPATAAPLRQQRDTPVQDLGGSRPLQATATSGVTSSVSRPRATPQPPPVLVEDAGPSSTLHHTRRMAERPSARDYRGALMEAEGLLAANPQNLDAKRCAESCREMLAQKYLGSLGGREQIPRALMPPEEIRWLSLDHRAGFLLSFVDGAMSIEEVLDVSSMAELDALQIMYELREQGVIEIAAPVRRPGRRT
jgi:hypothetical protein